jgi:NitT/TauT family transport system ATP-binding protein
MGFAVRGVGKTFGAGARSVEALRDLSFAVGDGEFVAVVGPNGCGKTTLLRLLAGLTAPSAGSISWTGSAARQRCAMVFQREGLLPWRTVVDNMALGLELAGVGRAERRARAHELVEALGLRRFADFYPAQLSGGMQQRVAIARAFLTDPDALLLDEPFGALDAQSRLVLQDELLRLWERRPRVVVHVTHDIEEAVRLADRVVVLSGRPGRLRRQFEMMVPRPRDSAAAVASIAQTRWEIWQMLRAEVSEELGVAPEA